VNKKLEGMLKESAVAKFQLVPRNISGRTEENTKNLSQDSRCPVRNSNWAPPEYKSEASPLDPTCSSGDGKC
jgi:hypothetical protein